MILRDTCVAFGHNGNTGGLRNKAKDRAQQVRCARAAVGTEGQRLFLHLLDHIDHTGRGHAHHRAACGIKAHRTYPRQTGEAEPFGSSAVFLGGGDRLQPADVGPACLETIGCLVEHLDCMGVGQGSHRLHDFARGADRSGHQNFAPGRIRDFAGKFGRDTAKLMCAALCVVEFKTRCVRAETVGEKQVRPRVDRAAIEFENIPRLIGVPELWRLA